MPGYLRFLVFANFRNRGHMCVLNYLDYLHGIFHTPSEKLISFGGFGAKN